MNSLYIESCNLFPQGKDDTSKCSPTAPANLANDTTLTDMNCTNLIPPTEKGTTEAQNEPRSSQHPSFSETRKAGVRCLYTNTDFLQNKIDLIEIYAHQNNVDIIAITEIAVYGGHPGKIRRGMISGQIIPHKICPQKTSRKVLLCKCTMLS